MSRIGSRPLLRGFLHNSMFNSMMMRTRYCHNLHDVEGWGDMVSEMEKPMNEMKMRMIKEADEARIIRERKT